MVKQTFHINQIYLDGIKAGTKHHEYRLGTPNRRSIKVNDVIRLQSDNELLDVIVKEIELYPTWKDALIPYWEQDFKDIYQSIDQALLELERFYSKEDVKKYQIIVYQIEKK